MLVTGPTADGVDSVADRHSVSRRSCSRGGSMNRCLVWPVALFVLAARRAVLVCERGQAVLRGSGGQRGGGRAHADHAAQGRVQEGPSRRGAPKSLILFAQRAVAVYCSNGQKTYAGPGTELDGGPASSMNWGTPDKRIRKGKFSVSGLSADEGDTQTITGHVSKRETRPARSASSPSTPSTASVTPEW